MKRHLYNVIRNEWKVRGSDVYWCVPKRVKEAIASKGFKKRFLACNARATNEYRACTHVVYAYNLLPNTFLYNFLVKEHVAPDRDKWALSELIQFIMRSAVRDGKPIKLYIPSRRMRDILTDFLEHGVRADITTRRNEI